MPDDGFLQKPKHVATNKTDINLIVIEVVYFLSAMLKYMLHNITRLYVLTKYNTIIGYVSKNIIMVYIMNTMTVLYSEERNSVLNAYQNLNSSKNYITLCQNTTKFYL